jgi:hypothetical protein
MFPVEQARYAHLDKTNLVEALALLDHRKRIKF